MIKIQLKKIINSKFLIYNVFTFIVLSIIFSRSFLGLYLFNLRVGEIYIAFSGFILIITLFFYKYLLNENHQKLIRVLQVIAILFLFTLILTNSSLLNPYTFRTSSYIWSVGFLILGIIFTKYQIKNTITILFFQAILLSIFYVAVYDSPDFLINFFQSFSDKYEPHKGSDVVLNFILINMLFSFSNKKKNDIFELFLINSSIFLPLLLYKSRAAFIAALIYIFLNLYSQKKYLKIFNLRRLIVYLLMIILIIISTFLSQKYIITDFSESTLESIPSAFKTLGEYKFSKYKDDYPILYISNKRIYSGDGNLNWRLQLWQDAIEDNIESESIISGFGYKEKLKVFVENNTGYGNDRVGLDGLNENVHNYFLTIFLRGGVIQLAVFLFFYWNLFRLVQKNDKLDFFKFFIPLIFVSLFDSSMENSHFPLIFYFFIGNQFIKN